MDAWVWIVIVVAVLLVLAAIAWSVTRRRRSAALEESFGPEYDRTIEESESRRAAERELRERQDRRDELDIRPLAPGARDRYSRSWEQLQAQFVDDPARSVSEADELIQDVMRDRGYPVDEFEQRAADLSVDHSELVANYRAAHGIARKHVHGEADTEELRQALVHYRSLFDELLESESSSEAST